MKRILLAVCFIFSMLPIYAREGQPVPPLAVTVVHAQTSRTQMGLYETIYNQLQQYYNRTDFTDPDHTTGWYRVDDFLTWLKANEQTLSTDLAHPLLIPANSQTLGVYLGARYIAHQYGVSIDGKSLQVHTQQPHEATHVRVEDATILLDPSANRTLPAAITLGMHEGAHLLPRLTDEPQQKTLCELAAFYAQHHYGLPVEVEDAKWFSYGVRDIRFTSTRKGYALVPLTREYALHVVGLVILPNLSPQLLLRNYNHPTVHSDITIATAIARWHALTKQQLVAKEEVYEKNKFLENLLGNLAQQHEINEKTTQFFDTIEQLLPPAVQTRIEACFPLDVEAPTPCTVQLESWMDQNAQLLVPAIQQALLEVHAPPPPPLAHGYL